MGAPSLLKRSFSTSAFGAVVGAVQLAAPHWPLDELDLLDPSMLQLAFLSLPSSPRQFEPSLASHLLR